MNFDILQKPETSGDQREQYRWFYRICEILNDIGNIIALGTGLLVKTGTGVYTVRTITGTATEVDVADGDGVTGNPVISLPTVISTPRSFGDGTNQTTFEADGTMVAEGEATTWNDINISLIPPQGNAATPAVIAFNGDVRLDCYGFSGTNPTPDEVHSSLEVLHDYKEGSDIHFHLHWAPTDTNTGDIKWQFRYVWYNRNTVPAAAVTMTATETVSGVAWQEKTTAFILSGTGKTMGSRLVFSIFRDATDAADTYAHNAAVTDVGIHYEKDTMGSRQITTK